MTDHPSGVVGRRAWMIDNQLPVALARHLQEAGYPSVHVRDIGLADADDRTLWEHAKARGWVLVSKDEDFQALSIRLGPPPQVVWVRLGNCRKPVLLEVFDRWMDTLVHALDAGEAIVELRD